MASKTSKDSVFSESTAIPTKMGLERFMQIELQKSGIAAILRRRYASQVHTQAEWGTLVENILNRKVR